jgi:hypothetical protein
MTSRDTWRSSVSSAEATKVATLINAEMTKQVTIDANKSVVGYTLQTGNYANFASAVASANQARWLATFNAEHAKQVAINAARDTLRDSGDRAPA